MHVSEPEGVEPGYSPSQTLHRVSSGSKDILLEFPVHLGPFKGK